MTTTAGHGCIPHMPHVQPQKSGVEVGVDIACRIQKEFTRQFGAYKVEVNAGIDRLKAEVTELKAELNVEVTELNAEVMELKAWKREREEYDRKQEGAREQERQRQLEEEQRMHREGRSTAQPKWRQA